MAPVPGATIRALRERRGLSRSKLARMCDLPDMTLERIENGVGSPKVATVEKIAAGLGVRLVDLFKEPVGLMVPRARPAAGKTTRRRKAKESGLVAVAQMVGLGASMLAFLALPGAYKFAAPIIHRMEPRSSR